MLKTKNIALILGVLIMSLTVSYFAIAWQEPTAPPPGDQVPAPINIGDVGQRKHGDLRVEGFRTDSHTWLATEGGSVGIGTTTTDPGAKLEVAGQIKITGGIPEDGRVLTSDATGLATWEMLAGGNGYWTQSGSNLYPNNINWRVGIGTTEPNNLFQVKDLISFVNTREGWYTANTALGYEALRNPTFNNNTHEGVENTAVGYHALRNVTTGSYNTALGTSALRGNRSGIRNIAIGESALINNRSGKNNIAIGSIALHDNQTGGENVAIGTLSLVHNTGDMNTGLGHQTLRINTTGESNTAVGANSMYHANGNYNTALGAWTYRVGHPSNPAIGSYNTLIGYMADLTDVSFSNATVIGARTTLSRNNAVRIGDNNVTWIGGNAPWTNTSDRRAKENIQDSDLGLDFIKNLRPVSFVLKNDEEKLARYGFIAQEVEELLENKITEIVTTDNTSEQFKYTTYTSLIAPLVKAVQEQQEEINELKAEIQRIKDGISK